MGNRTQNSITYRVVSEVGNCRNINQDAVLAHARGNSGIFVVADGMGGHNDGEFASNEIIKICRQFWNQYDGNFENEEFHALIETMEYKLQEANDFIFREKNGNGICGTTVIVLLVVKEYYALFSVGDSRIYTCINRRCIQLTVDDIWDNLSSTRELYAEEEIEEHNNRGKLVHAVGISDSVEVQVQTGRLHRKQSFLLCSDGLYKCCEEQKLQRLLKRVKSVVTMESVIQEYRNTIYKSGATDNFSMILVRYASERRRRLGLCQKKQR